MMAKRSNYKFFNKKNLYPVSDNYVFDSAKYTKEWNVLMEARDCWDGLHEFRLNRQRNGRFTFGDQWKDKIPDPDKSGKLIAEEDAIRRQGKVPLKNNLIRQLVKSVQGQFRNNKTEPVAVVRDSDETKIGEMMSIALQYAHQLNQVGQLDSEGLQEFLISSSVFQKVKYDLIPTDDIVDAYIENKNPARMFWNAGLEDTRGWDLKHIGEIHDLSISDVINAFAKNKDEAVQIRELYRCCSDERIGDACRNMSTTRIDNLDFLSTYDNYTCRVIESWKRESKEQLFCHDFLSGDVFWMDTNKKKDIENENAFRIEDAEAHGVDRDDVPLIEYEWKLRRYWYFRFLTPMGDVLMEGESPYWHSGHPYVFRFFGIFDGKAHSFVEDVIDQQKMLNRMVTLNDFLLSSGSKETLFVDTDSLDGTTLERVAEDYVKVGSVIGLKLRPGIKASDVVHSVTGSNKNIGTYEMINLMMQFINDISGVQGALKGERPPSGTAASLYAQEVQNSSINIVDILETFNAFRTDRDGKLMKVIQQYYDDKRYINIAGKDYSEESKYYNPEKVRNAKMDISISQSTSTSSYRTIMDTFLMELLQSGAITLKMFLENTTMPFKDRLLQSIVSEEERMAEGSQMGAPGGIPPELMQEVQQGVDPEMMASLENGISA